MNDCGLITSEGRPVPLVGVVIEGRLRGGRAAMTLRQRYRNDEPRPIEAVYVFPLPADAVVTGVSLRVGDRVLTGAIRERERAFQEYDAAIATGHGAALLDRERHDVLTVQAGNLLPGEETAVEIGWTQAVDAVDGELVWSIPTVVAPRFIPGAPSGDRTAHGTADPTDRVPDADRITPPVGWAPTGLTLDLLVDLGVDVEVESPSHSLTLRRDEHRVHVSLADPHVVLDRDLVLTIRGPAAHLPLTAVATHRAPGQDGAVAITVVPDLAHERADLAPQTVVFLVDTSGSMGGTSITEARAALRLCLRHLREGDRFDIIAFESSHRRFDATLPRFDQRSLERADAWVAGLRASGGTELLAPLVEAVAAAPDGVVVLLTDGQVGNEAEILRSVMAERRRARIYSFGIGAAVSDGLLTDLARSTGGAVERIYPGQSIDERVIAQFARATAARIEGLSLRFEGVELHELTPAEPDALVDGEPWVLHGRYATPGSGSLTLVGRLGEREVRIDVPLALPEVADRPDVLTAWASERFRELDRAQLTGRRATANQERMLKLALEHGLATRLTSFVVIEEREGARRASGQPETRVVAVHAPHGWAMFQDGAPQASLPVMAAGAVMQAPLGYGGGAPMGPPPPAPRSRRAKGGIMDAVAGLFREAKREMGAAEGSDDDVRHSRGAPFAMDAMPYEPSPSAQEGAPQGHDSKALLQRQLASGLWDDAALPGDGDSRRLRATAAALLRLCDDGLTTAHPVHGALLVKAVDQVLQLAGAAVPADAEPALAAAWLVTQGRRRRAVEQAIAARADLPELAAALGDPSAVEALLRRLLP